tara:strand:- start:84 stop:1385 length:1302 start_codon:yes stop_codon:yes gene_type:complete
MATLDQNKKYHLLLYLISPIMGLIYGIRTKNQKYVRWSIFIFVFIYGAVLHPSHLGDGATHFERLSYYSHLSFSQFWNDLISILSFIPTQFTNDDPYIHILSYVTTGIFNRPSLFFVGVAFVFAYFYSGAIVMLLSYVNWKSKYNKFYFTFFLVFLLLWQNPGHMQSVRLGTAIWVVIYAIMAYHKTNKIKYVILLLLTPLVHFAFLIIILPFCLVLFTGYRKPMLYFIVFMISILSTNLINSSRVNDVLSQTEIGVKKVKSYTLDDARIESFAEFREEQVEKSRFYKVYQANNTHYNVLTVFIIFIFLFSRKKGFGEIENTLFSYGLAGASAANFLRFNFALYNRIWVIATIFILILGVVFLSKHRLNSSSVSFLKIRLPLFIFVIALLPYLFYQFSAFLNFSSIYSIFMPLVMLVEYDMGLSIRGFIGLFL